MEGQLCDASKWAFSLAWQQVSACPIYGKGSPVSHGHIHWERALEDGLPSAIINPGESQCFARREDYDISSVKA